MQSSTPPVKIPELSRVRGRLMAWLMSRRLSRVRLAGLGNAPLMLEFGSLCIAPMTM